MKSVWINNKPARYVLAEEGKDIIARVATKYGLEGAKWERIMCDAYVRNTPDTMILPQSVQFLVFFTNTKVGIVAINTVYNGSFATHQLHSVSIVDDQEDLFVSAFNKLQYDEVLRISLQNTTDCIEMMRYDRD